MAVLGLERYVKISRDLLLTNARRMVEDLEARNGEPMTVANKPHEEKRHKKLKEKKLQGYVFFFRQTEIIVERER